MDTGGEIVLGSSLITLVEPHKGHEVAYNRWYERDHMLAGCMVGPWLYSGRRWVATRDEKALRSGSAPDLFGDDDPGTYLAVYFVIDGKQEEHFEWGTRQVRWLHDNGRMFPERDHVSTSLYKFGWSAGRDHDGVPQELALEHPYSALVLSFVERADGVDWRDLQAWFASQYEAGVAGGIGQTLLFRPIPMPEGAPVTQKGPTNLRQRSVLLRFADVSPAIAMEQADAVDANFAAAGLGTVQWSSPFRPTIPGTDTYTDILW